MHVLFVLCAVRSVPASVLHVCMYASIPMGQARSRSKKPQQTPSSVSEDTTQGMIDYKIHCHKEGKKVYSCRITLTESIMLCCVQCASMCFVSIRACMSMMYSAVRAAQRMHARVHVACVCSRLICGCMHICVRMASARQAYCHITTAGILSLASGTQSLASGTLSLPRQAYCH